MIDLGLARIGRLLQHGPPPAWRAIQVSGTNGKGSVCAYLSAMLHARSIPSARFTSPHIVDRWDCIVINERVVAEAPFRAAEQAVLQRDRDAQIGATEFELLTATAFELFDARLPASTPSLAVIECGLGGGSDATTAMRADRAVTVITRIGLDHQGLLGNTVADIATHKAGIMRPGVPCVVDPANGDDPDIRRVLEARAREVGTTLVYPTAKHLLSAARVSSSASEDTKNTIARLEPHQLSNLACAYAAFRIATGEDTADAEAEAKPPADTAFLASILEQVRWPGRLQKVDIGPLLAQDSSTSATKSSQSIPALLDGAHNAQSADVLGAYVNKHLRSEGGNDSKPITWILAASHGKDLGEILRPLLRKGDRAAAVTFGAVDGMPWVQPALPQTILDGAAALGIDASTHQYTLKSQDDGAPRHRPDSLISALRWATSAESGSTGGPIVIAGSLYLVSDTLRQLQKAGGETGMPL